MDDEHDDDLNDRVERGLEHEPGPRSPRRPLDPTGTARAAQAPDQDEPYPLRRADQSDLEHRAEARRWLVAKIDRMSPCGARAELERILRNHDAAEDRRHAADVQLGRGPT